MDCSKRKLKMITIRIPENCHADLIRVAKCKEVSMNQYCYHALRKKACDDLSQHGLHENQKEVSRLLSEPGVEARR